VLLVLAVTAAASAENPAEKINLQQAISTALSNNSGYKIAQEAALQADEQVNETWSMLWPQLSHRCQLHEAMG
jgi:outer membrane protein TolC